MKALRVKGLVQPDHKVILQLPSDIQPGEHAFILVVEDLEDPAPSESWPTGFLAQFAGSLADTNLEAPDDSLQGIGHWQGEFEREQPPMPQAPESWR